MHAWDVGYEKKGEAMDYYKIFALSNWVIDVAFYSHGKC